MQVSKGYSACSLGAIVYKNGKNYILTASHCVSGDSNTYPDQSDLGRPIEQGNEKIGHVSTIETTGILDVALISIDSGINSEYKDFLGNKIEGFGQATEGTRVYKIGKKTGVTYGTIGKKKNIIFDWGKVSKGYVIEGKDFCDYGDSGSAIITVDSPHKIVGILAQKNIRTFPDLWEVHCFSNNPEDVKNLLGL